MSQSMKIQATIVPMTTLRSDRMMRQRSSSRWSKNDIPAVLSSSSGGPNSVSRLPLDVSPGSVVSAPELGIQRERCAERGDFCADGRGDVL